MLFSIITALMMSKANGFVLEDPYHILLKDNTDYKIEEFILEEEYEMYDRFTPVGLNSNYSSEKERVVTNSYSGNQVTRNQKKKIHATSTTAPVLTNTKTPKGRTKQSTKYWHRKKGTPRKYISMNNGTDYTLISYDFFLKEHAVTAPDGEERFNQSSEKVPNSTELLQSMKSLLTFDKRCKNCTEEELKHIGFKAVCCLLGDYQKGEPPRLVAARLWRIVKIWALVYLCVALPLWCMKGWCCCCLCCKFFKPRQTIEEAKQYFLQNPPGVLKVNRNEIQYEPSENERDSYEEFEHLLRTI